MNRLDQLLEQKGRPTLRGWPWLIMALLAAFLIWAYVATLERVVVAEGEVAPQGRVKVIQHLEGGVIEAFHVAEGDRVASGDPLVSLNIAAAGLNRSEIETALAARRVTAIRLAAEADGSVPDFATAGADRRAPLVAAELAVFVARRAELDSEIAVLQEQQARLDRELEESKAKRHAIQENLSLAGRELELVTALFEEKLVAELKVLNAQQTVTRLAGELDVHNRVINTRQSKRTESEAVIAQAKARFYRRAREEAALNQAEIAGVEERLKLASDQARRATIRYWQADYASLLADFSDVASAEGAENLSLQLVIANAAYRVGFTAPVERVQLLGALDSAIGAYLGVLQDSPGHRDAAYNYEYLLRLRADVAAGAELPRSRQSLHGQEGESPEDAQLEDIKIYVPVQREVDPEMDEAPTIGAGGRIRRRG